MGSRSKKVFEVAQSSSISWPSLVVKFRYHGNPSFQKGCVKILGKSACLPLILPPGRWHPMYLQFSKNATTFLYFRVTKGDNGTGKWDETWDPMLLPSLLGSPLHMVDRGDQVSVLLSTLITWNHLIIWGPSHPPNRPTSYHCQAHKWSC